MSNIICVYTDCPYVKTVVGERGRFEQEGNDRYFTVKLESFNAEASQYPWEAEVKSGYFIVPFDGYKVIFRITDSDSVCQEEELFTMKMKGIL